MNDQQILVANEIIRKKGVSLTTQDYDFLIEILSKHKNQKLSSKIFENYIDYFSRLRVFNSVYSYIGISANDNSLTELQKRFNSDIGTFIPDRNSELIELTIRTLEQTSDLNILKHAKNINDYHFRINILKKLNDLKSSEALNLVIDYLSDSYTAVRRTASAILIGQKNLLNENQFQKLNAILLNSKNEWRTQYITVLTLRKLQREDLIQKAAAKGSLQDRDVLQEIMQGTEHLLY